MNERTRGWLYFGSTVVLIGLLIVGLISNEDAAIYLGMIGTAVGIGASGLATANTNRKSDR